MPFLCKLVGGDIYGEGGCRMCDEGAPHLTQGASLNAPRIAETF